MLLAASLVTFSARAPATAPFSGAPPPHAPSWPSEWSADTTRLDLKTNASAGFRLSWSAGFNATLDDFRDATGGFMDVITFFSAHEELTVIGGAGAAPRCTAKPRAGGMDPPDVSHFTYNGEQEFPEGSKNMICEAAARSCLAPSRPAPF